MDYTYYASWQPMMDRDVLQLFVVRYDTPTADTRRCYLNARGQWIGYDEGSCLEPALSVPGPVAHVLRSVGISAPEELLQSFLASVTRITHLTGGLVELRS